MNESGHRRRPSDGNRQRRRILAFVQEFTRREGYSPSYRQIGDELGLAVSTVSYHVGVLQAEGFLHREPRQPRTITGPGNGSPWMSREDTEVPLIGEIAAGAPLESEEAVEEI